MWRIHCTPPNSQNPHRRGRGNPYIMCDVVRYDCGKLHPAVSPRQGFWKRPVQQLWDATNARPPVQALPAVERSTGPAVGEGQGGDEEGEAEVESGGLDFLRTYVGRAAPPVEEEWDSDEEEEEQAVAAAGVMREEEEELGGSDPRAPGIGVRSLCVFFFVWRKRCDVGAVSVSLFLLSLVRFPWSSPARFSRISLLGCWVAATELQDAS